MAKAEMKSFLRSLPHGWQATLTARGHIRLFHPEAVRVVIAPGNPSDWRNLRNIRAEMRRAMRHGEPA